MMLCVRGHWYDTPCAFHNNHLGKKGGRGGSEKMDSFFAIPFSPYRDRKVKYKVLRKCFDFSSICISSQHYAILM